MAQTNNTFIGGLNTDVNEYYIQPTEYVDALNAVVDSIDGDLGTISNELGNKLMSNVNIPIGFIILGYTIISKEIVLYLKHYNENISQIGVIEFISGSVLAEYKAYITTGGTIATTQVKRLEDNSLSQTSYYNSNDFLNFNLDYRINSQGRVYFNKHRIIYFTDDYNNIRSIDLDELSKLPINKINFETFINTFSSDLKVPIIKPNIKGLVTTGGNLGTGIYQVGIRYGKTRENTTDILIVSNPISVVDESEIIVNSEYDGAPPNTEANKQINLSITNIDTTFPFVEIILITYEGLGNTFTAGIYETLNNINDFINIEITTTRVSKVLSLEEITIENVNYKKAKCINSKDGILLYSNLESEDNADLDFWFQTLALSLKVKGEYKFVVGETGLDSSSVESTVVSPDSSFKTAYKSSDFVFQHKHFRCDEPYSIAFVPVFKSGKSGSAYHIPPPLTNPESPIILPALQSNPTTFSEQFKEDNFLSTGVFYSHQSYPLYFNEYYTKYNSEFPSNPNMYSYLTPPFRLRHWYFQKKDKQIDNNDLTINYLNIDYTAFSNTILDKVVNGIAVRDYIQGFHICIQPKDDKNIENRVIIAQGIAKTFVYPNYTSYAPAVSTNTPVNTYTNPLKVIVGNVVPDTSVRIKDITKYAAFTSGVGNFTGFGYFNRGPIDTIAGITFTKSDYVNVFGFTTGKYTVAPFYGKFNIKHFFGAGAEAIAGSLPPNPPIWDTSKYNFAREGFTEESSRYADNDINNVPKDGFKTICFYSPDLLQGVENADNAQRITKIGSHRGANSANTRFGSLDESVQKRGKKTVISTYTNMDVFERVIAINRVIFHNSILIKKKFKGNGDIRSENLGEISVRDISCDIFDLDEVIDKDVPKVSSLPINHIINIPFEVQGQGGVNTPIVGTDNLEEYSRKNYEEETNIVWYKKIERVITKRDVNENFVYNIYNEAISCNGKLETANYISLAYFKLDQPNKKVFGDIFFSKYAINFRTQIKALKIMDDDNVWQLGNLYYGWFETTGNYAYRHKEKEGLPYFPKNKNIAEGLTADGKVMVSVDTGINTVPLSLGDSTGYNKQYHKMNNLKVYYHRTIKQNISQSNDYSNRTIYSLQSIEGELRDNFLEFKTNNYYDITRIKGEIWNTFVLNNEFYIHTTQTIFKTFMNPITQIATSSGQVILGSGTLFNLPASEITTVNGGYAGIQNQWTGIVTPEGYFFLDSIQKKIFLFSNQLKDITAGISKQLFNLINDSTVDYYSQKTTSNGLIWDSPCNNNGVHSIFDYRLNRYIITFNASGVTMTMSYSLLVNKWVSKHSYIPTIYIQIGTRLLSSKFYNQLWEHFGTRGNSNNTDLVYGKFYGIGSNFTIKFIINTGQGIAPQSGKPYTISSQDTKVFDNFVIKSIQRTDSNDNPETNNLSNNYKTFDEILLKNSYQYGFQQLVTNNTDFYFEQLTEIQHLVKYKDLEFKLTIPRDSTPDEARFRDKFLSVELTLNQNLTENNFKFVLHYITTFFRTNNR